MTIPAQSMFELQGNGIANDIRSDVWIGPAFDTVCDTIKFSPYKALCDTGAACSIISDKLATDLALYEIGRSKLMSLSDSLELKQYLISLKLPNLAVISAIEVASFDLSRHDCDLIIGMDVITMGDFAVSSFRGQTAFSFRIPSIEQIDFRNYRTHKDK